MPIRLPHVLAAMALILLAGLGAVAVFEARAGGASVPGVVLLAQPELDEAALAELAAARPGARLEWVPAADTPLAPFDGAALGHHVGQGYDTVLLAAGGPPAPERGWQRRVLAYPDLAARDAFDHATDDVLFEIRTHAGTRPFLVGVLADPQPPARVARFLDTCAAALAALPDYRRSALVVLGARAPDGERRLALRLDVGRWAARARPALADLLEPGW